MYETAHFKKKLLATFIATSTIGFSGLAYAQEKTVEEVIVTGIRASMTAAMDIKRESAGVVDAISAEDIGKFPDSNLAESLQRITGVSIDRVNGEGSKVTVRGFGSNFNLVLLNGRNMPTASSQDRSFDFSNLAADNVAGVEVYKTGKASISTGGMGATINLKTTKPLDTAGFVATVGAKAISDTSNRVGDDITPELSGLVSWSDEESVLGAALSVSHSARDFGTAGSSVNGWNIKEWDGSGDLYGLPQGADVDDIFTNQPAMGQLYARPDDRRHYFEDSQRVRDNAQLTLQYQPVENLVLTGDYTLATKELDRARGEHTQWFGNQNTLEVIFDDNPVATPLFYEESTAANPANHAWDQSYYQTKDKLTSLGFNVDWQVNDIFNLNVDLHDSSAEQTPNGPGNADRVQVSFGAPVISTQYADYSTDSPTNGYVVDDGMILVNGVLVPGAVVSNGMGGTRPAVAGDRGNMNGISDYGDLGTQASRVGHSSQVMDISEVKIDGTFEFETSSIEFGVESRAMESTLLNSERYINLGDWGVNNPGEFPPGLIQEFNLPAQLSDYGTYNARRNEPAPTVGYKANAVELLTWALSPTGGGYAGVLEANPDFNNNVISEDTNAVYFQFNLESELAGRPANLLFGARYETTDVTSATSQLVPLSLDWQGRNNFRNDNGAGGRQAISADHDYDHLLPSLDFNVEITEDIIGRFSASKTIARPAYTQLYANVGLNPGSGPTILGGLAPSATVQNPQLDPLESQNVDISFEWYFAESSVASIGFFEKRVNKFIGEGQSNQTWFGIKDGTNGPRAAAAQAELERIGRNPNNIEELFVMMINQNADDYYWVNPNDPTDIVDPQLWEADDVFDVTLHNEYRRAGFVIAPEAEDPDMIFVTSAPENNKEAQIYGIEMGAQHFFGETGFGLTGNLTLVNGDVKFDDTILGSQFALPGLSDSANMAFIYEKYGFSARLAANWRDEFLSRINGGGSRNPEYTEAYTQWDMSISYDVLDNLSVSLEGINITGENVRKHARSINQLVSLSDDDARYQLGARYSF
jgi:TonB-dependent receptor